MRGWALLAVLMLVPVAAAGTPDDPEITDPSGDSVSTQDGLAAGAADILQAWIEGAGDDLHVSILLGSAVCADPTETIEYRFFLTASEEVAFGADIFGLGPGFCSVGGSDTTIEATGAASDASYDGDVIVLTVPRTAFGDLADGDVLTGFYGTSQAYVGSPDVWNDSDRAPDEGSGRAYVVGGVAEPVIEADLGSGNASILLQPGEPVDDLWVNNWTSAGGAHTIGFESNTTEGEVGFLVADSGGAPLWQCACDGTGEQRVVNGTAGNWTLMVEARGFAGTFRLDISETPDAADNGTGSPPEAPPDGNSTTDADPGPAGNRTEDLAGNGTADARDKGAPLPLVVPVAAAGAAVARRRR